MPDCKNCTTGFEVTDSDRAFYKKMDVPEPTLCPDCRFQRRMAWRNERNIYPGICEMCGEKIISLSSPESDRKVYCQECWWSDKWDPMEQGKDFDFSRPFFSQFAEMLKNIPMCNLVNIWQSLENSKFVSYVSDAKNCYLVFAANFLEDCMYSSYIWESKDVLDCSYGTKLELCYSCLDCDKLYNCKYLQNSKNCSDCTLGYELHNCKNCFGCTNLKDKEYYFFNEELNKDEYKKRVEEAVNNYAIFEETLNKFKEFSLKFPKRFAHQINCENTTGDGLKNCKNCQHCFDGYGGEDLKWMINFPGEVRDCYDVSGCAQIERAIDSHIVVPGYNIKYSNMSLDGSSNIICSAYISACENLFGCAGLKRKKYCILNKQYTKEEYEKLLPKIIEHMKTTEEWGEFFPAALSPYKYNETIAHEYFPMKKEEVLARGWKWSDYQAPPPKAEKVIPSGRLPDRIEDIPDDILNWAIECEESKKPFKILAQELKFYRKMGLPVPKYHPDIRHLKRLELRNPRKLYNRTCAKCSAEIQTTYSPKRPERVYCEECYLKEVY